MKLTIITSIFLTLIALDSFVTLKIAQAESRQSRFIDL